MLRRAPALRHAGVVFIRKTATRARRDGGSYTSFRLVESVRSGSQVSQRTLLNLGSGFAVPPERWPELVLLVESLRSGQACLLATLALALDGAGFPRCSEVLKGNVSEPGTLQAAIERLEAQREAGPLPTVVMDAGLSTEANLAWLRARGYPWITVQRGRAPDAAFATRAGHPVQAWRVDSEGDETHLRVWSQQRQQKDEAIVARRRERFEAEVRALHAGLARKGCTKRYDKVLERLGRLKERYRQVAGQYDIAVERGSGKGRAAQLATAIRIEPNGKHPARDAQAGMYVLRTSHTQWGPERVVQTYWQLAEIEAAFRSLKGEAGLRPIFHVKPSRIRAHLFLAVLAYHGVHLLRKRLAQAGLRSSWETIRRQLAGWVRLTTSLRAADGRWIQCRQDSRPDAKAAELARASGLMPGLHRMRTSHAADATPSPSSTQ